MSYSKSPKNCPNCECNSIAKNGFRNGVQRYKCKKCKTQFQSSRRPTFKLKKLMSEYFFKNNH